MFTQVNLSALVRSPQEREDFFRAARFGEHYGTRISQATIMTQRREAEARGEDISGFPTPIQASIHFARRAEGRSGVPERLRSDEWANYFFVNG